MIFKKEVWLTPYDMSRTLHIYVPDGLAPDERCEVLYMFDGHNLFWDEDATYGKSWGLREYLDAHPQPLIVVGVECNHEGNKRLVEYSPFSFHDHHFGMIEGSGKQMMEWMTQELKPLVDRELPTLPQREHTWIGGSSMGGLMALYAITQHNDTYSKAACLSPFLAPLHRQMEAQCRLPLHPDTRIYLSWGSNEARSKRAFSYVSKVNLKMANRLNEQPIALYLNLVLGGQHCEACWEKEIPAFLHFLKSC